jgi:cytochrome c peroxidase
MDQLRKFALTPLTPDTSNAVGDNPMAMALGKKFYFDARFSGALGPFNIAAGANGALGASGDTGKVACASCHDPNTAGVDHRSMPDATSLGAGYTGRNAPTVINAAFSPRWQFWDGRVDSLWSQALGPPEGAVECNSSRLAVVHTIFDHYQADYDAVFPPMPSELASASPFPLSGKPGDMTFDSLLPDQQTTVNKIYANFGKAIAAYERQLISANFQPSSFDAFLADPKGSPMSDGAVRGARLFIGHAGCAECHAGHMFTDSGFHNIGAPQTGEHVNPTDEGRATGVVAFSGSLFNRGNTDFSDDTTDTAYVAALKATAPPNDLMGLFKTPTLRNVSRTAPYMHDGAYHTLWDVVNHYNFGGETGNYAGQKDPAIAPLMLSDTDLSDIVEFLRALEDGPALPSATFPEGLAMPPTLP